MGVASYFEDDFNRFLSATMPQVGPAPPPVHHCPFCTAIFEHGSGLNDHLGQAHWGAPPALLIAGRPISNHQTITQPIFPSDITVQNCTAISIRRNGVRHEESDLASLLARETDSILDLEMENLFESKAEPARQSYRLTLRIPSKAALDDVDRSFLYHLANGVPHLGQIATFLNDPRCLGVARGYADSLAAYVRGVVVKDQADGSGITLRRAEADNLFSEAIVGLAVFRRPIPTVICGLVRLSANNFSAASYATGSARLDRCNALLAPLSAKAPPRGLTKTDGGGTVISICPIDHATDRILDLSDRLERQNRWGPILEQECREAANAVTLTPNDRAKILALWATTALRLEQIKSAIKPLRQLRSAYPFSAWAEREIEKIE